MTELTKEYAVALFSLGLEGGMTDSYADSLDTVLECIKAEPEYLDLLSSPGISGKERAELFCTAFEGKIEEDVMSFVSLLCETGRIRGFEKSVSEYKALLDASHRVSAARVVSTVPLTDDEITRIKEKLEVQSGNTVHISCEIDPSLIGGIMIEIDGKVIDGSIRRRLQEVKEVISK